MILTLRLVGFAFELNTAYQNKTGKDNDTAGERYAEILCRDIKPGVVDIVHYSFNYVGLLAGIKMFHIFEKYKKIFDFNLQVRTIHIELSMTRYIPISKILHLVMGQLLTSWRMCHFLPACFY